MKDSSEEHFKSKGEGFGKIISYLNLALESLTDGEKDITKAKNLITVAAYSEFKKFVESAHKESVNKNYNIYFDSVPDANLIPKVEKLIKAFPSQPPDDFNKYIEGQNCLDDMVPNEVKIMVEKYKQSVIHL